jgi:hypothetical protein
VAATLTDSGELTHLSFGIEKIESTPDGDLMCYGRASDGSVDHDQQIVDPHFSSKSIREWLESGGNVRVQHNAQRDPAGVGLEVSTDGDGATWVKSLIVEPVAKKLLAAGALRAYSVGIARPTIVRDAVAKGGRITDGQVVEISLVDRPANARCGIQLVKSMDDGSPEYVGKVFGADDAIQKALSGDVAEKSAVPAGPASIDTWTAPADLDISFTPNDLMKIVQGKIIDRHYDELALKAVIEAEAPVYKRDIDTATRRRLAADGKALPNLSYPIETAGDLGNAAHLARTGHGDVAAARRLIARRARELGVANPLDEGDSEKVTKSGSEREAEFGLTAMPLAPAAEKAGDVPVPTPLAEKEAEPELTKDPEAEAKDKPVKKAKKKPKKLPPWLNKPKGDDGDGDSDDDDGKADKAAGCTEAHEHTGKCHTPPSVAAGVTASPMNGAPLPASLPESDGPDCAKGATPASASGAAGESMQPVPSHREPDGAPVEAFEADAGLSDGDDEKPTRLEAAAGLKSADLAADPELAALMRFKHLGIDENLGRLHDFTCPAYHPDQVAEYHPYSDLPGLIDSGAWQKKAMLAAAGPLEQALKMQDLWAAVHALKSADQGDLNDYRAELHKAFRDANPGPGTYPTPGSVSPQRYRRPVLTDGRAANSPAYGPPTSAPQVATSPPNAQDFDRPPLSSAHASPSPSFMKGGGGAYPADRGVPQRISYAQVERDKARRALSMLHDHLNHMFPSACPMLDQDAYRQPEARPVPVPAGIGKSEDFVISRGKLGGEEGHRNGHVMPTDTAPVAAFKATPEDGDFFADADVYKAFKKMRKKLGKRVLSGKMTVDEARAKLGRQFTQKGGSDEEAAVQKSATAEVPNLFLAHPEVRKSFEAKGGLVSDEGEVLRWPPAAPPAPVAAPFGPEDIEAAVTKAVGPLLEKIREQDEAFTTKLAEQQKVIDAIADQPDPSTAAFSGLAFNPAVNKAARPAAVPDQAEYAARAQDMIRRNLQSTYYNHSSPAVREAAGQELAKLGWEPSMT